MQCIFQVTSKDFTKGRIFCFVDESGDPGHISETTSSSYYQLNLTLITRDSLSDLHRHMSAFRYFKDTGKELKRYSRDSGTLSKVFIDLVNNQNVIFSSFLLQKQTYTGPYLEDRQGNDFRGFLIATVLHFSFSKYLSGASGNNNIEVVIDRYLESDKDEHVLRRTIQKICDEYPEIKITQIDSEYCEAMQVTDYIGRYVKEYFIDDNISKPINIFEFIEVFSIDNPKDIKQKAPNRPIGC